MRASPWLHLALLALPACDVCHGFLRSVEVAPSVPRERIAGSLTRLPAYQPGSLQRSDEPMQCHALFERGEAVVAIGFESPDVLCFESLWIGREPTLDELAASAALQDELFAALQHEFGREAFGPRLEIRSISLDSVRSVRLFQLLNPPPRDYSPRPASDTVPSQR